VRRRVLEHDHAGREIHPGLDDLEDVAAAVRERLPVDQALLHVGVARQRPHVVAVVVVDRRLVPEPPERGVGVGVDGDVVGVVVDVAGRLRRHRLPLTPATP
jgi:hypothetical protein